MKKKVCNKIADALLPYLSGYAYEGQPNAIFQVPVGNVFRGMILDSSGFSPDWFYPHVFILPLYVPTDRLSLSFGKRLPGNWVYEEGREERLAIDLAKTMERDGALTLVDDLSTPDNIARNLHKYHPNPNDPYLQQAVAYSHFMCGRSDDGLRGLDMCCSTLREMQQKQPGVAWHGEFLSELSAFRNLAGSDFHAATEQLNTWTESTRSTLGLPD